MSDSNIINVSEFGVIKKADVRPVTVKRLATLDGLGIAQGLRLGEGVLVDMSSLKYAEITNKDGHKHNKMIIHKVDIHGNDLGWLFAEFFFDAK